MTELSGATVLITGAGGGFGQEMVRQFSAAGSRLVLADMAWEEGLNSEQIIGQVEADFATMDGPERVYEWCQEEGVIVDVLVNNAGISHFGLFHEYPPEKWAEVIQINLLAPMRLTQLFLPEMRARNSGHIVTIASLAGWVGTPGIVPYTVSKFGLRGLGEGLLAELANTAIEVTTVYPFYSRTPIIESEEVGNTKRPELADEVLTDPADVIKAVVEGVRRNEPHVFPDPMARRVARLKRYAPWLLPRLVRDPRSGN